MNDRIIELNDLDQWIDNTTIAQLKKAIEFAEDANVDGFIHHLYSELFIINFNWGEWDEGRNFLKQENPPFDTIDETFCYKLLTAIQRNDRFSEGVLEYNLKEGVISNILYRILDLKIYKNSLKYRYKRKPRKCPVCHSKRIAKYLYGMPAFSMIENDLKEEKIVLGGCCISEEDPKWKCLSCETDFYKNKNISETL